MTLYTVEVKLLGTTFTCEVEVTGPTVDDWQEVSIKSEGDLIKVLQCWSMWGHYDELMGKIADKLCGEGIVK